MTKVEHDMSAIDQQEDLSDAHISPEVDRQPPLSVKIDLRWQLTAGHLAVTICLTVLFILLSYLPLRGTDLWLHVNYGGYILESGALPTQPIFEPLSKGMKLVNSAWLSQVILSSVHSWGGPRFLSALFAFTGLASFVLLSRAIFLRSKSLWLTALGLVIALITGWSRTATIRPENFALLCFAALLFLISRSREKNADATGNAPAFDYALWIGAPLVMLLWVNLHGSFVCGILALGAMFVGRAGEVFLRTRSIAAISSDSATRQWLFVTELSLLATLLNPAGIDMWLNTLLFAANQNLAGIVEWQPMVLNGTGGFEFAGAVLLAIFAFRYSRRRVPLGYGLMLLMFGVACIFGVRMLTWFAFVYALVVTPHVGDMLQKFWSALAGSADRKVSTAGGAASQPVTETSSDESDLADDEVEEDTAPSPLWAWKYSFLCMLSVWVGFALTPISHPVLGTHLAPIEKVYDGPSTPLQATAYLKENPPEGQVFNPQIYGDWLVMNVPGFKPFVTTNIHTTPRQVWRDYQRIYNFGPGWPRTLERYRVNMMIFDKEHQSNAKRILRTSEDWRLAYEDDQVLIYRRAKPLKKSGAKSAGKSPNKQKDTGEAEQPAGDELPHDARPTDG